MVNVLQPKTQLVLPSDQEASGRTLGSAEIAAVTQAIESGTLTSTKGTFVKQLEAEFAKLLDVRYAYACTSGSAAIHCAIAALDLEPGDEVITTSITDMGALTPLLYQGIIPRFCDVDPVTLNVTAETIEAAISDRTKAVIVTHLFGNPCDMDPILALAQQHQLAVIEDSAQAFLATYGGRCTGAMGTIGCFSFQQGKHITTGEGGLVTTNDPDLARRIFLFINKAFGYGDPQPDHYFLALNYRMSELQGAVALAQLGKLSDIVAARQATAASVTDRLQSSLGITPPQHAAVAKPVYWKYCLQVDADKIDGGAVGMAKYLKANYGIFSAPRYIQKPAFECEVIAQQRTFGKSRYPFTLATPEALDYSRDRFPGTYAGLERVLVLPWNEAYTEVHLDYVVQAIQAAVTDLSL